MKSLTSYFVYGLLFALPLFAFDDDRYPDLAPDSKSIEFKVHDGPGMGNWIIVLVNQLEVAIISGEHIRAAKLKVETSWHEETWGSVNELKTLVAEFNAVILKARREKKLLELDLDRWNDKAATDILKITDKKWEPEVKNQGAIKTLRSRLDALEKRVEQLENKK